MRNSQSKRTLLFVLPWSLDHLGGVNQVVINLARQAINAGEFEPIVLVSDWRAKRPIWEEIHGLRVMRWRIRPFVPGMNLKERLAYLWWELSFSRQFHAFCNRHAVAAINLHYPTLNALAIERTLRVRRLSLPLIVSFHGTDVGDLTRMSPCTIAQWRRVLRSSEGVVVCSRDLGQKLSAVVGDEVAVHVIHNGVDAAAFASGANDAFVASGRVILNVGRFEEQKGQDVLIKAFASIADNCPDVNLLLVGPTTRDLPRLKALCTSEGLESRVQFVVDVPHHEIATFFRRATIFCLPSRREAFGITILEAGSLALPVVASRVGGIPEIISDGVHGRLVAPDDPEELAACLQELLDAPAVARQMGARLRERIIADFSWTTAYNKYAALMRAAPVTRTQVR